MQIVSAYLMRQVAGDKTEREVDRVRKEILGYLKEAKQTGDRRIVANNYYINRPENLSVKLHKSYTGTGTEYDARHYYSKKSPRYDNLYFLDRGSPWAYYFYRKEVQVFPDGTTAGVWMPPQDGQHQSWIKETVLLHIVLYGSDGSVLEDYGYDDLNYIDQDGVVNAEDQYVRSLMTPYEKAFYLTEDVETSESGYDPSEYVQTTYGKKAQYLTNIPHFMTEAAGQNYFSLVRSYFLESGSLEDVDEFLKEYMVLP